MNNSQSSIDNSKSRARAAQRRSTIVENPLQIGPIMQNKPNFPEAKMSAKSIITRNYEEKSRFWLGKNKPNSKPKQTQSNPNKPNLAEAQNERKLSINKGL